MFYEYVMWLGYASIVASLAMTVASEFDVNVTLKRTRQSVALKHYGQHVFMSDLVTLSKVEE